MGKIVVIGSLNMDVVVNVDEMPEKGQTVSGKNLELIPGGKGANQAYAAAKLGGRVSMIGAVGDDDNSGVLIRNLETAGVDVSGIDIQKNQYSGTAFIFISSDGDNQIVAVPGTNANVHLEMIDKNADLIKACDVVVMQLEIPLESVIYAAALAKENGKTVNNPPLYYLCAYVCTMLRSAMLLKFRLFLYTLYTIELTFCDLDTRVLLWCRQHINHT